MRTRIEPTPEQLEAAWLQRRRRDWPPTLAAVMAVPLLAALVRMEAVRREIALRRPLGWTASAWPPASATTTEPTTPSSAGPPVVPDSPYTPPATPRAAERPYPATACGSAERLAVLRYLANRPVGATRAQLAELLGLDETTMQRVLIALRNDERAACDKAGIHSTWYVPCARQGLSQPVLLRMGVKLPNITATVQGLRPPGRPSRRAFLPASDSTDDSTGDSSGTSASGGQP